MNNPAQTGESRPLVLSVEDERVVADFLSMMFGPSLGDAEFYQTSNALGALSLLGRVALGEQDPAVQNSGAGNEAIQRLGRRVVLLVDGEFPPGGEISAKTYPDLFADEIIASGTDFGPYTQMVRVVRYAIRAIGLPNLSIIILSGNVGLGAPNFDQILTPGEQEQVRQLELGGCVVTGQMRKPFDISELEQLVRHASCQPETAAPGSDEAQAPSRAADEQQA